ncbi:MAG: hypothetical protein NTV00_04490 [Methylococcales bacterium]|nr:hypothetical protein [Methylococcales bacterium]
MNTINRALLLAVAIATLAACQQSGDGPSKPASASTAKISTQ